MSDTPQGSPSSPETPRSTAEPHAPPLATASSTPRGMRLPPSGARPGGRRWFVILLLLMLCGSLLANVVLFVGSGPLMARSDEPYEQFLSGSPVATDKIAVIRLEGTIMPPFTDETLRMIERARDDDFVKGVLLTIDSPGGLVADSHQIYHRLVELRKETGKPVYVAMKRIAASGGYYVAMGCGPEGRIYAEPTTWTGSIGVIIPRYDVSGLAKEWEVRSDPLKTGRFKDALSPFRPLTPDERDLWAGIVNESFDRFLTVIDENRPSLEKRQTEAAVAQTDPNVVPHSIELVEVEDGKVASEDLATGRIFPATEALEKGLIDEIGFEDDALDALQEHLGLDTVRIVEYQTPPSLLGVLLGSAQSQGPAARRQALLDATVPRAMYYFSWVPPELPLIME